jgi:hypothetical protein
MTVPKTHKMDPVIHFEMPAEDTERARTFYETAFGWRTTPLGAEAGDFVLAFTTESDEKTRIPKTRGAINGGLFQRTEPAQGTQLTILVDDIEEAVQRIQAAGGEVLTEPFEIQGVGLFARFKDTEGNIVQVNQDFDIKRLPQD